MTGGRHQAAAFLSGRPAMVIVRILAIGIALVLAISAIKKSIDPRNTIAALEWAGIPGNYGVRGLVAWEMVLAAGLSVWVFPRLTTIAATLTFFVFSAWIVVLIAADAPVGCGCRGSVAQDRAIAERPKSLLVSSGLTAASMVCMTISRHVPNYNAKTNLCCTNPK